MTLARLITRKIAKSVPRFVAILQQIHDAHLSAEKKP
jgi:hypothetical protein